MKGVVTVKFKETEIGTIPEGWDQFEVADLTERVIDNRGKTPPLVQDGYELLEVNAIKAGNRTPDYSVVEKFIDEATYNTWFRGGHIKKGDLIIPTVGTIGNIAISLEDRGSIAQNLIGLRFSDRVEPTFIYYLLSSLEYKEKILNLDIGGVQPSIKVPHLMSLKVFAPELAEQKQIAEILSSLDDKIELNRKINANLEKLASALFKKWFVDIGDDLPEGWRVEAISNFGQVVCGKTPSKAVKEYFGGDIPFIKIPDMHGNIFIVKSEDSLTELGMNSQKNKTVPLGSICVSCIATVGLVSMTTADSQTNQQINSIIPSKHLYQYYLLHALKNLEGYLQRMGSSGSATLNVNTTSFSSIEILKPTDEILEKFDVLVRPVFEQIKTNVEESLALSKIRDSLLPRLMSGKIRVKI